MSVYADQANNGPSRPYGHQGPYCGFHWRPFELIAMVLGFIVFWPIGLAILGWKVWQKKTGYGGDLAMFAREKWQEKWNEKWERKAAHWQARGFGAPWSASWTTPGTYGSTSTGNSAFDDWRSAELARLEEERQKLIAAEREFAEFLENLRRAKDREEFDRFMAERRNRASETGSSTN
jgi:hypothetical protein